MKIGIDLGGTNTVIGLCSPEGVLVDKLSLPTRVGEPAQMKQDMCSMALQLCAHHFVDKHMVTHIGLGVPGSVDKLAAMLVFGPNLGMDNVCFTDAFAPEFPEALIQIDNDANCAALGEVIAGAGRNSQHVVMITLGTGVGGAIVINGKLYTGFNDAGGEIGHMTIVAGGVACSCGRRGCLECYTSATAMIRMASDALKTGEESILRGAALSAKTICDARDAGDVLACRVFDDYCMYLGGGLTSLVNILQPEKIIIGGGVAGYGEKLLRPLRETVRRESFRGVHENTKLVLAELGNDAGLIGAAML